MKRLQGQPGEGTGGTLEARGGELVREPGLLEMRLARTSSASGEAKRTMAESLLP